jgi:hypothetical protein
MNFEIEFNFFKSVFLVFGPQQKYFTNEIEFFEWVLKRNSFIILYIYVVSIRGPQYESRSQALFPPSDSRTKVMKKSVI